MFGFCDLGAIPRIVITQRKQCVWIDLVSSLDDVPFVAGAAQAKIRFRE